MEKKLLLEVEKLNANINEKQILRDFNLAVGQNELHVIMGPNGCGKSTFSKILAGHPAYEITSGDVSLDNKDFLELSPEQRSHEGLFLAFQYPVEIAGVSTYDFLRIAYNEKQKYLGEKELDPLEFMEHLQLLLKELKMRDEFLSRNLNEGFSGGEKKKNEILQMLLLKPKIVILDEIDSGLDIDAIKVICEGIKNYFGNGGSIILITHYPRILDYLEPTHVHIMKEGKIQKTGKIEIIDILEKEGYSGFV